MKKVSIANNKKLLILAIILMIFVILVPIGYALFSHSRKEEKDTHIGEIKVELVEDWPDKDTSIQVGETPEGDPIIETYTEEGIRKYSKSIHGHSVAELDAYVRVRFIPIVEYFLTETEGSEQGEWITLPVSQDEIVINVNPENNNWVKQGDYWYYKNIIKTDENTDKIDINWQVNEIPSEAASYKLRTDVRVILEYSQTTNDKWKDIFQIESFPSGVQLLD